jgi:hypothetical protein
MADTLRIKRRDAAGLAGAPSSLAAAEIAYNEKDDTLYYGKGNNAGQATTVLPIAGPGTFAPINSPTFTGDPKAPTPATSDSDTSIATTGFVKAAIASVSAGPALATVSDTAPASPLNGQLWWKSNAGKLLIWIVDVNSAQWVQIGGAEVNK